MCVVVMKEDKKNYRGKYFQPVRLQRLLELIQSIVYKKTDEWYIE